MPRDGIHKRSLALLLRLSSGSQPPTDQGLPSKGWRPREGCEDLVLGEQEEAGKLRVESHFWDNDAPEEGGAQWPTTTRVIAQHH